MGNAIAASGVSDETGDIDKEDQQFLAIQNAALTNDSYVASVFDSLPKYDGTIPLELPEPVDVDTRKKMHRYKRLSEIYSNSHEPTITSCELEQLNCRSAYEQLPYVANLKMRSRLLQRLYVAYCRSTKSFHSSNASELFLCAVDAADGVDDAASILTATSIRMSLAIMQCLQPTHASLFGVMCDSILQLLSADAAAGALLRLPSSSPHRITLNALFQFAKSAMKDHGSEALGLMLALGVTCGSLEYLLTVVSGLLQGSIKLPRGAETYIHRLQHMRVPLSLSIPSPDSISADIDMVIAGWKQDDNYAEGVQHGFATDGVYQYILDYATLVIFKVGTGIHGTIAGNIYGKNDNMEEQLRDMLGDTIYRSEQEQETQEAGETPLDAQPNMFRRGVITREINAFRLVNEEEGLEQSFNERNIEYEDELLQPGTEIDIEEERTIQDDDRDLQRRFFRISNSLWLPADDSDHDHSSSEMEEDALLPAVDMLPDVVADTNRGKQTRRRTNTQRVWLAVAADKLYVRMMTLLGPHRLAVFSLQTLMLESVLDVVLPIPELISARAKWLTKPEVEESKDDDGAMEAIVGLDEWEDGPVGSLFYRPHENVTAAVIGASSNFQSNSSSINNLLATDGSYNSEDTFCFAPGDRAQELIVDMGGLVTPTAIGAEFDVGDKATCPTRVQEKFSVFVSSSGEEYTQWGHVDFDEVGVSPFLFPSPSGDLSIRFIRFCFGCAPDEHGSGISRLSVLGITKVKKQIIPPFPAMISDGRHLLFIHAPPKNNADAKITLYQYDPLVNLHTPHRLISLNYELAEGEMQLHQCAFAFNSEQLLILHSKNFEVVSPSAKTVDVSSILFSCVDGTVITSQQLTYPNKHCPLALNYDVRNNLIWGWCPVSMSILKWRNKGVAPIFSRPPTSEDDLVVSGTAAHRVTAFEAIPSEARTSTQEAALLLSYVDRLSSVYGPTSQPVADADALNEILVQSAGKDDGNYASFSIRDIPFGVCERGVNIAVLDSSYQPIDFRTYDTQESTAAADRFADYVDTISNGRYVMVAFKESAAKNISSRAVSALCSLGAQRFKFTDNCSFAMIGRKGMNAGQAHQRLMDRRKGSAIVRLKLPVTRIPLCVECSRETLSQLISLVVSYYNLLKVESATMEEKSILISSFSLLTTNIHHLLNGSSVEQAQEHVIFEDRQRLKQVLTNLINCPPPVAGGMAVARASLRLFVTAISLLFPSPSEKCSLLIKYLDEFSQGTLSVLEKTVLELLLRQISAPAMLSSLFTQQSGATPGHLLISLLGIAKKEFVSSLVAVETGHNTLGDVANVGDAAVGMLSTLCNIMLSECTTRILGEENSCGLASLEGLNHVLTCCDEMLESAMEVNARLKMDALHPEIDLLLKASPLAAILPVILNVFHILFCNHGPKILSGNYVLVKSLCESVVGLSRKLSTVMKLIPQELLFSSAEVVEAGLRSTEFVFESAHPYAANVDEMIPLLFPGALKVTITFDEQTKLENNYDWIKFWKDSSKTETWHQGVEKFTGRNGSEVFPGIGSTAPLVIEGSEAYLEFHTDGSNEDWGWKFTAIAEYKRSVASAQNYWWSELDTILATCGASLASSLIIGVRWDQEKEKKCAAWLEDSLLLHGVGSNIPSEELSFLTSLIDRPSNSLGAALCGKMKRLVSQDQGSVEDINRAVYATCAALIRHNGLISEAIAFASDNRSDASPQLLKVWRAGQKMRNYFDLGDIKNAAKVESHELDIDDLPPAPVLERGPSVYSGADSDAVKQTSMAIVKRAQFLLKVNLPVAPESSPIKTKKLWGALAQYARNDTGKTATAVDDRWRCLVGEVQAAYRVKGMLSFRRASIQRKSVTKRTLSEKILLFLQGRVSVEDLEAVISARDERATVRADGLQVLAQLLQTVTLPASLSIILTSFGAVLHSCSPLDRIRSVIHYRTGIEGCSAQHRMAVDDAFRQLLHCSVQRLAFATSQIRKIAGKGMQHKEYRAVVLNCLRALALDYDVHDHAALDESHLLPSLMELLDTQDFEVCQVVWAYLDMLVPRCVGLEGQTIELTEASQFSKNIVLLLVRQLQLASSKLRYTNDAPLNVRAVCDNAVCQNLLQDTVCLHKDVLGYSHPHTPIGLHHTVSFWFRRAASNMEKQLMSGDAVVGCRAQRGPDWKPYNVDDVGTSSYGTITRIVGTQVTVKWDNGKSKTYSYGSVLDDKKVYEVVLVDDNLGGVIYSKGMKACMSDEQLKSAWAFFGLQLYGNATLKMFAASGGDGVYCSYSCRPIPAEEWTHVAVVHNGGNLSMYFNGECVADGTLPNHMLYAGSNNGAIRTIESEHPYRDNTDEYTLIEIPGATSITIVFDPMTKTEQNYDYLRFYKNESHTDYWGEEKYSGGRGSSSYNWPGLNGAPPLVIPASRFVLYFKTDGSNNDWGYKMTCTPDIPRDESQDDMIATLNEMPWYFGQPPSYASNRECVISAEGSISKFQVYNVSLSREQIVLLAAEPFTDINRGAVDESLCLDALSLVRKASHSIHGITSYFNAFVNPDVLEPLMYLIKNGSTVVKCCALRICSSLFPHYHIEMIDHYNGLLETIKCKSDNSGFLYGLCLSVGRFLNFWDRYVTDSSTIRSCGEISIWFEELQLLRHLAVSEQWGPNLLLLFQQVLCDTPSLLQRLVAAADMECSTGNRERITWNDVNLIYAILAVYGGTCNGIYPGAAAKYSVGDDGTILENCTILSYSHPPVLKSGAPKDEINLWKDITEFGDALVIIIDSQPQEVLVVPRSKVHPARALASAALNSFLAKLTSGFVDFLNHILAIDCNDKRPVHIPRVTTAPMVLEFQSNHPYEGEVNTYETISIPGAREIVIEFDIRCRTEKNSDYVRIYKDDTKTEWYGEEKYHGRDGEHNWPGVAGNPSLVVNADNCVVYFHSDGTNSDWGYKLTARGLSSVTTYPPQRPPLVYNSMLGKLKFHALQAAASLAEDSSAFRIAVAPLMKALIGTALSPTPKIKAGNVSAKPLMFESSHPYEHNKNEYTPICIRGAKKLIITFDEMTNTENGCDYVRFYKDDSHTEMWGEQYSGGKDGGNCNWPSIKGRPPLEIPADSFVLHFRTDGSVNSWGWRFWVTPKFSDVGVTLDSITSDATSYSILCFEEALCDGPAKQTEPSGLHLFDIDAPNTMSLRMSDSVTSGGELVRLLNTFAAVDQSRTCSSSIAYPGGSYYPKKFHVNSRVVRSVSLRAAASANAAVVASIGLEDVVTALVDCGDWLLLRTDKDIEGWSQRRNDDIQYLLPQTSSPSDTTEEDYVNLPDEPSSSSSNKKSRHPMYEVVDQCNVSNVKLPTVSSAADVISSKDTSLEISLANMTLVGITAYAQDCVANLLANWHSDVSFSIDCFGDLTNLLSYMRTLYLKECSNNSKKTVGMSNLEHLKKRVVSVLRQRDGEARILLQSLLDYALLQLLQDMELERMLRPTKAKVKYLECKHPYEDNMDEYWELSIPGAKWMQIVFDGKTSTEKDCDYVLIYKDSSHSSQWGTKYTGRKGDHDKQWAGLGSVPACVVKSDKCVVHFHSDSSNTDWGFKLACYGVMEEASEEERNEIAKKRSGVDAPQPELACWILDFLVTEAGGDNADCLFNNRVFTALRKYCNEMPDNKVSRVVHLLTNMVREAHEIRVSDELLEQIRSLHELFVDMANKQGKNVSGDVTVSQSLQAVVQASIVTKSFLWQYTLPLLLKEEESKDDVPSNSGDALIWSKERSSPSLMFSADQTTVSPSIHCSAATALSTKCVSNGTQTFSVRFGKSSKDFVTASIGIVCNNFDISNIVGCQQDVFNLGWREGVLSMGSYSVPFGPRLRGEDEVQIEINFSNRSIRIFRNSCMLGIAVGPTGSGAAIISDAPVPSMLFLAVTLFDSQSVTLLHEVKCAVVKHTTKPVVDKHLAPWHNDVFQAYTLMCRMDTCKEKILESYLRGEFDSSNEKRHVVLESNHPWSGGYWKQKVHIPYAESLHIYFDRSTAMLAQDTIRIATDGDSQVYEFTGLSGGFELSETGQAIYPHDLVVRGDDWEWGEADGGVGGIGEVKAVGAWNGVSYTGVRVQWRSGVTGYYRYGYDSKYDVRVIGVSKQSLRDITVCGDSLQFEVLSDASMQHANVENQVDWNGALYFDGQTSSVTIPYSSDVELNSDFVVETWIRVADVGVALVPIVSRQIELEGRLNQFCLCLRQSGDVPSTGYMLCFEQCSMELGNAVQLSGGSVAVGEWSHVAICASGNNTMLLINGSVVARRDELSGSRMLAMEAPLHIGCDDEMRYFKGHLFDMRIWNTSKSVEAIASRYKEKMRMGEPHLVMQFASDPPAGDDNIYVDIFGNPLLHEQISWDSNVEPTQLPMGSVYGFKCTIVPTFNISQLPPIEELPPDEQKIIAAMTSVSLRHDVALARYVNEIVRNKKLDNKTIQRCKWHDIAPSESDLLRHPVVKELIAIDAAVCSTRFDLLLRLNKHLSVALPFIDLCAADQPWSVAALLSICRGVVLECTKMPVWDAALTASASSSGGQFELRLSRSRAAKQIRSGAVDVDGRTMVFSQAFRQIHTMNPNVLRRSDQLYTTRFMGERAHDAGGPYRESFAFYALELQSSALPLLVRTPNGRNSVGINREKWVLNPGATTDLNMEMFAFFGKLMGIAIRSREYLALNIPSFIWKLLVCDIPTRDDLEGIDAFQVQSIDHIRHAALDEETFRMAFADTLFFATTSTDDRVVELIPGGSQREVTFKERHNYCDLVEEYRLHEFDRQADAVRRGLACIVPIRVLSLFTWDQLETMVCGLPTIDIELLRSVTEYSSCSARDDHVQYFWQALADFSNDERSVFLRFCWGRSRLPLNAESFSQRFKLQNFNKSPADAYLPVAHTCFFSLELPAYSSLEVMKEKLRYAIFNCQAIDGDDTSIGMQAAAMGWEE